MEKTYTQKVTYRTSYKETILVTLVLGAVLYGSYQFLSIVFNFTGSL